jgi:HK97 gp10 family phage protein
MSSEVIINENTFALEGGEEGLKKAILETAIKVHANAVPNAPADTGALRNSIMWRTPWDGDGGFNTQPKEKAPNSAKLEIRPQGLEGIVGTNLNYAVYQEFGTRYQRAQPFLRPAGDAVRGATAAEIGKKWGRAAMEEEFKQRKKTTRKI